MPDADSADWFLTLLSIGIAAVWNPVKVLKQTWPHVSILVLFAVFVAWNGGVVLGKHPFVYRRPKYDAC